MKKYKTKLSFQHCNNVIGCIQYLLKQKEASANAKVEELIAYAALAELLLILQKKSVEIKKEYSISFSNVQAFALVYLYHIISGVGHQHHLSNRLLQINNEILQHFSVCKLS